MLDSKASQTPTRKLTELSLTEVLAVVLASCAVFMVVLHFLGGSYWWLADGHFGDTPAYLQAAAAIRHWQFSGVDAKQFWGLPYAMASVSILTGMSETWAMIAVCVGTSIVSVVLCYWLWDGWVAVFFALLSLDWLQRSLLGGAEPLFVALVLGSFLALRKGKWEYAAILGALATVVRPFGVFVLIGLGIELLYRKKFRECAIATTTALVIGALYVWPLQHYLGNPFANVAAYQQRDWRGGLPFNLPFVAIFHDTIPINAPWTNLLLTGGWILLVLIGVLVAVHSGELREYASNRTAEACFVLLYGLALYTYDAPGWSRSNFPRFAIPMLPWILAFLRHYLPKKRPLIWGLAVVTPALAAASAVGIRQAARVLRHWI